MLLAGPVVGTVYFFAVYLLAEASCAAETTLFSTTVLRLVIVGAGAASVLTLLAYAWRGRQLWHADDAHADARLHADAGQPTAPELAAERRDSGRFMLTVGLLMLGMFLLFALFLAAPSVGGALC